MIELKAKVREQKGKGAAHQARAAGEIPGVLYGGKSTNLMLSLNHKEVAEGLKKMADDSAILSLSVTGGKKPGSFTVITREVQRHFRDWKIQHVDFQKVDPDATITLDVPVVPVGDWTDQMGKGSILLHRTLKLKGKAKHLPGAIKVPVDTLEEGQKIAVKDLKLPEGVQALRSPEAVIIQKA
ncbi:MAG: 50S ribosomal protein L25 [bacterium]